VVGLKLAKAEAKITNAQLTFKAVPQVSTTGTPNVVTRTSPQAGLLEPKGTQVTIYYNVKPGTKALPDVSNMTASAAIKQLNSLGWKNVTTSATPVASMTVSKGDVVSTSPKAGTKVPFTQAVTLNVSGGGVRVPFLDFLKQADAIHLLTQDGLVPAVVNNQPGPPGAQPGTVWQTKPGHGAVVVPGSTVAIYVVPGSASPTPTSPSPTPSASASPSPAATP
jgi:serine/threonine-protein kinase